MTGLPDLALPFELPLSGPARQVVSEFLLPRRAAAQGLSSNLSRFFSSPQETVRYPPRPSLIH